MESVTHVLAAVTGSVWKIEAHEGDVVSKGTVVAVIESMKMEVPCEAPTDGRVTRVLVQTGQAVNEGDHLMMINEEESGNA